jgi:uncharacterized protein YlzI (FlbEa/FlbD family)
VIEVTKLDGSTMHLNEDLVTRVEFAVGGQSAIYLLDGGHVIVAHDPSGVVERIRSEKVALLRRVFEGPEDPRRGGGDAAAGVTRLSEVRSQ